MVGDDHFKIGLGARLGEAGRTRLGTVRAVAAFSPYSPTVWCSAVLCCIFSPTKDTKTRKFWLGCLWLEHRLEHSADFWEEIVRGQTGLGKSACLILHIPLYPSLEPPRKVVTSPRDLNCRNELWSVERGAEYRVRSRLCVISVILCTLSQRSFSAQSMYCTALYSTVRGRYSVCSSHTHI